MSCVGVLLLCFYLEIILKFMECSPGSLIGNVSTRWEEVTFEVMVGNAKQFLVSAYVQLGLLMMKQLRLLEV